MQERKDAEAAERLAEKERKEEELRLAAAKSDKDPRVVQFWVRVVVLEASYRGVFRGVASSGLKGDFNR